MEGSLLGVRNLGKPQAHVSGILTIRFNMITYTNIHRLKGPPDHFQSAKIASED